MYDAGGAYSWREWRDLVEVAAGDVRTRLGAALAGWAYPASMAEIATIVQAYQKHAAKITPWGLAADLERRERERVTPAERAAATKQLARVSMFRELPGFDAV